MRKQLVILGVGALFITLCFSGCEELGMKPTQVTVNVMIAVYVKMVDEENNELATSADGVSVFIEMRRQNRDRLFFDRIVQGGLCQATGSYTLTKGQWVNCTATIKDSYMGFYPVAPAAALLTWDTVDASVGIVDVYNWYPKLTITMKRQAGV